jgi:hypothetical protein
MRTRFWSENHKGTDRLRDRHRMRDNIKMSLREVSFEIVDLVFWLRVQWQVPVYTVMEIRVP